MAGQNERELGDDTFLPPEEKTSASGSEPGDDTFLSPDQKARDGGDELTIPGLPDDDGERPITEDGDPLPL